jgi:hypothetical protein
VSFSRDCLRRAMTKGHVNTMCYCVLRYTARIEIQKEESKLTRFVFANRLQSIAHFPSTPTSNDGPRRHRARKRERERETAANDVRNRPQPCTLRACFAPSKPDQPPGSLGLNHTSNIPDLSRSRPWAIGTARSLLGCEIHPETD